VPLRPDANVQEIGRLLCDPDRQGPYAWPGHVVSDGALIAGTPQALRRIARQPRVDRPELAAALKAAGDSPLAVLVVPGEVARRTLEEMLPSLPQELGGGPITTLTRGLRWAALGLEDKPKPVVRVIVEGRDQAAAESLRQFGHDALKLMADAKGPLAE